MRGVKKEKEYKNPNQVKPNTVHRILTPAIQKKISSKSPSLIELSAFLFSDKRFTNDAKAKLSINDYNMMCKNTILRRMMADKLGTTLPSLTKFCKIMKNVGKNVDLSKKQLMKK